MTIFKLLSPMLRKELIPFGATCILYLLQPYDDNTFKGATFKALPVACLVFFIISIKTYVMHKTTTLQGKDFKPSDPYTYFVLLGLVTSVLSDLLCGMSSVVMVIGTLLFSFTYFCYFLAISTSGRHTNEPSRTKSLYILLYINMFLFFQEEFEIYVVKVLFAVYLVPLFLVSWKATAAYENSTGNTAAMCGCIGAILLLGLEAIQLVSIKGTPVPFTESLFCLVYFMAQLCLTLSVIDFET